MKYSKEIFYQEFIRREDSTNRAPYNPELEFYSIIQNGDIEQVKELCKASPLKDKKGLGLFSLCLTKYLATSGHDIFKLLS